MNEVLTNGPQVKELAGGDLLLSFDKKDRCRELERDDQSTRTENRARERSPDDAPFLWVSKSTIRKIRDAFDAKHTVSSALSTYFALCEVASDKQGESFETTHAWLAMKSGLSVRTIDDRVGELAELGVIEVKTPALKAPSTYRLLSVPQPFRNEAQPLPNVPQLPKQATLRSSEESIEESIEQSPKKKAAPLVFQFPAILDTDAFRKLFLNEWVPYRKGLKKVGNWQTFFQRQLQTLSDYGQAEATQRLTRTMINGWTGFDFNNGPTPQKPKPQPKNYSAL